MNEFISAVLLNIKLNIPVVAYDNSSIPGIDREKVEIFDLRKKIRYGKTIVNYSISEFPQTEEELAFHLTNMPRIHTGLDNENYVGYGFGNCLYASGAIFDYRERKLSFSKSGISSVNTYYRSGKANTWWEKALKYGIAQKVSKDITTTNYYSSDSLRENHPKIILKFKKQLEKLKGIQGVSSINVDFKYQKKERKEAVYASLESFITAGWIPILVKPGRFVTSLKDLYKDDVEYAALELFDFVDRNKLSKSQSRELDDLIERMK